MSAKTVVHLTDADRRVLDDALQERGFPPLSDGELLDALLRLASDRQRHDLACRFAKRVPEGEDQPRLAIEAKRAWLRGEISDDELRAARATARAAWYAERRQQEAIAAQLLLEEGPRDA